MGDLFQVSAKGPSLAAQRLGSEVMAAQGAFLEGAFFRDEGQMKSESRRSVRIDDSAQCVIGLTRTLQLLDDLVGVDVPQQDVGSDGSSQEEGTAEVGGGPSRDE